MQTALFTNFSNEPFTGYWNGKGKTFQAGQSVYMPDYLAKHFAKHLTNRELLKIGKERDTSPRVKVKPDGTEYVDNETFNEMFSKAYTPEEDTDLTQDTDEIDVQIAVANKNRAAEKAKLPEGAKGVASKEPQIVNFPDDDEDEAAEFGEQPVETQSKPPQSGAGK